MGLSLIHIYLAVVRRMMELQLKLMAEDPEQAFRDPCAIQPNGAREYHVRRNSLDNSENAEMFLVTGNIEIIESACFYYAAVKDDDWLRGHIEAVSYTHLDVYKRQIFCHILWP